MAGVDVEEDEEHQAHRGATDQDQPGFGAVVVRFEGRRAAEARQPGAAGNLHRVVDDEARERAALRGGEQQRVGQRRAVEEFDVHIAQAVAEDAVHDVVRAKRAVHESEQRLAARVYSDWRDAIGVDRQVDQEAGLHLGAEFLHQRDLARQRRQAGITRALHRLAAHRLGVHVVPEGAQVAIDEGLEVKDAAVGVALAWRMDGVVGEAFRAHPGNVRGQLIGGNHPREARALDPGQGPVELERGNVGPPFRAADVITGGKECGCAAQDLLVCLHA